MLWCPLLTSDTTPRYSEASLVRAMEEKGIGRPSTYAPTISRIQRHYVEKQQGRFYPNEAANVVIELLMEYFPTIVDVDFTSDMESDLDKISSGEKEWTALMGEFWGSFSSNLENAKTNMPRVRLTDRVTTEVCPNCQEKYGIIRYLVVKEGRNGVFLGCPSYNDKNQPCDFTKPYAIDTGITCPKPDCDGHLIERMNNNRKVFYGCSNFPTCKFTKNNKPITDPCPECGVLAFVYRNNQGKCINNHVFDLETEDED